MIVDSLPHYLSWKETREDCTRWVLYDWESLYNLKTHSVTAGHNSRPAKQRLISLRIIAGCQSCQLCQEISLALLSLIEMKFFFTKYFQSPSLPLCGAGLSYRVFIRVDSLRHIRTISPHSLPSQLDNTSEVSQVRECRVSCRNNPPNQTKLVGRHQVKGAVGFVLIEGDWQCSFWTSHCNILSQQAGVGLE